MLPAPPSSAPGEATPPPPPSDDPAAPGHGPAPQPPRSWAARRTNWLLAGTAAAGCAYLAFSDPNDTSSWYPQCPFRSLTGYDCPGCGITRALRALVTGNPVRAVDHNALVAVAVVLGILWFGISKVRERTGRPPLKLAHPRRWGVVAGIAVVTFWVVRNLSWGPFQWLGSGASGV